MVAAINSHPLVYAEVVSDSRERVAGLPFLSSWRRSLLKSPQVRQFCVPILKFDKLPTCEICDMIRIRHTTPSNHDGRCFALLCNQPESVKGDSTACCCDRWVGRMHIDALIEGGRRRDLLLTVLMLCSFTASFSAGWSQDIIIETESRQKDA